MADILRILLGMTDDVCQNHYAALAAFHDQLRRVSDKTAHRTQQAGLQPVTFLLLLALRRQSPGSPATIGSLSEALQLDRGTVVELIDDLVRRGFASRERDKNDRRRFLISITPAGVDWLAPLARQAMSDLMATGPDLMRTLRAAVAHASGSAREQTPTRLDVADFAWRAVGPAPI